MTNVALIQQHLPNDLWDIAQQYTIADDFLVQKTELVELILRSRSMDKAEEKQSWFNLLPMMNDEQVAKLMDILTREKQKLMEIEQKYESKKDEIKKKYITRWQNMGYVKKVSEMKQQEHVERTKETEEAESLLAGI